MKGQLSRTKATPRHDVHMQVVDRLSGRRPVGLDDVQSFRLQGITRGACHSKDFRGEVPCGALRQRPNIRDVVVGTTSTCPLVAG